MAMVKNETVPSGKNSDTYGYSQGLIMTTVNTIGITVTQSKDGHLLYYTICT